MAARVERFLAQYRVYENLVRDAGRDPLGLEDEMDELTSNRMRMTRQFRNYLSHVPDPGFIEPTDKMMAFLDARVSEWACMGDVVRKHLKRPAVSICAETETCAAGLEKLAKLRTTRLVVVDKDGTCGLCDLFAVAAAVASSRTAKLSTIPRLRERPVFIVPDVRVEDVDRDRVNICTADGTPSGRILGVVAL